MRNEFALAVCMLVVLSGAVSQPRQSFSLGAGVVIPNAPKYRYAGGSFFSASYAEGYKQSWEVADGSGVYAAVRRPYEIGWRVDAAAFSNPIAGNRIGFAGVLYSDLAKAGRGVLGVELDLGLTVYEKPYSKTHAIENEFIGSYLNCLIHAGFTYRTSVHPKADAMVAAKVVHSSCGYLQKPNQGMNCLQCELSIMPKRQQTVYHRRRVVDTTRGGEWTLSYGQGAVMPRYTGASAKYFYAYTARVGWQHRFSPARAAGANLDVTYNCSHDALRKFNKDTYPLPFYVGLCANYESYFDRLSIHVGVAAYLLRSTYGTTPIYERVGLFYNFASNDGGTQFVGVSLKSHYAHIDFIEWHYGVKIRMNKKA